jgi:molybdenum cofactor biosynthesis enzyme MoaA
MKEWKDPYNSFNSMKGLLYSKQFDGIINGKLLPPIEVNIDPVGNCQLDCLWCNGRNIISRDKLVRMSREHLFELIDFCSVWGVKAVCLAGGGEPTLHPDLGDAIERTVMRGMESAIISNGLFTNWDQKFATAKYTRWCGISVDCATKETYEKIKKLDRFDEVIANMRQLVNIGINELTFKFLIHPLNQHEIFDACKLAKDTGCNVFHTRILSERYLDGGTFDRELINSQLEKCHELEDENFKVFTISHKQDGEGNRRINFSECKASPLLCMMEANGDVSVCIDRKGDPRTRLCSHENVNELLEAWGSERHSELLKRICPKEDCPKCTMTIYQELLEAYKSDKFFRNFP